MSRTHLPERNLDVLRAFAVSCVVADHVMWAWDRSLLFVSDWELGRIGVLLFFVHTSLVLMSSMERAGTKRHWVRDFYTRRAFRIYPLAMAAIVITLVFQIPSSFSTTVFPAAPRTILANMLLVQNISNDPNVTGVLWSLPIEVQMYVVLPALFLLARRSVGSVVAALAIAIVLALGVQYVPVPGLWRLTVALFGPCFVSGVLAFAILRSAPRFKLPAWTWLPVLAVAIPLLVVLNPTPERPETGWPLCLAIGIAIPFVAEMKQSRFTSVTKTICTYSYGVYLMVTPAIWIAFDVLKAQPQVLQWITFAAGLVALPWAAYTLVEHPAIVLGRNLVSARQPIAEAAPAP